MTFPLGIEFSRGGYLISFTQEVSVTNKDLTKLIRLNSNYRVSSLFNYLLNWCFLINFLIKMYSTKKTCKQALTGSQRRRDAAAGCAGQWGVFCPASQRAACWRWPVSHPSSWEGPRGWPDACPGVHGQGGSLSVVAAAPAAQLTSCLLSSPWWGGGQSHLSTRSSVLRCRRAGAVVGGPPT